MAVYASTGGCTTPDSWAACRQIDFDDVVNNECNGDIVNLTGRMQFMVRLDAFGSLTMQSRANWQGVKGVSTERLVVDPSDPTKTIKVTHAPINYTASDTTYDRQYALPAGTTKIETQEEYELISEGTEPNFLINVKITVLISASGPPEIQISGPAARCRG